MKIKITYIETDFPIDDFNNASWTNAGKAVIERYWSGEKAEVGRHAEAKLLWSENAFYVRFEAVQIESLVVSDQPNTKIKTIGLWNRDVCEIFVAPNACEPNCYFEFEIAPNGEWIDLKLQKLSDNRETDFEYESKMESAASIEKDRVLMAIKIPWQAFGEKPRIDEIWKGNLFRCVGSGGTRGYLTWQPTRTAKPDFHVPEAFGEFLFAE